MSFCVCLSTCVCLSMSDCSCSRRGWTDQPTSGPSGVRELHYASSSHLPIIIIIIISSNWIKFVIIITTIMVIVIVLSSSKLPLDTSWDQASKNFSTNEPIVFLAWLFSLSQLDLRFALQFFSILVVGFSSSSFIHVQPLPWFWCSQIWSLKVALCVLYLYLFLYLCLHSDAHSHNLSKWNIELCICICICSSILMLTNEIPQSVWFISFQLYLYLCLYLYLLLDSDSQNQIPQCVTVFILFKFSIVFVFVFVSVFVPWFWCSQL